MASGRRPRRSDGQLLATRRAGLVLLVKITFVSSAINRLLAIERVKGGIGKRWPCSWHHFSLFFGEAGRQDGELDKLFATVMVRDVCLIIAVAVVRQRRRRGYRGCVFGGARTVGPFLLGADFAGTSAAILHFLNLCHCQGEDGRSETQHDGWRRVYLIRLVVVREAERRGNLVKESRLEI